MLAARYDNPFTTVLFNNSDVTINTGAVFTLAVRNIFSTQYLFHLVNGVPYAGQSPIADGDIAAANNPGIFYAADNAPTNANGVQISNFLASNVDWAAPSGLGLSGPTTGVTGSASTNFTVSATTLSGSDTVTPHSDSGGTFTPTSLSFVRAARLADLHLHALGERRSLDLDH